MPAAHGCGVRVRGVRQTWPLGQKPVHWKSLCSSREVPLPYTPACTRRQCDAPHSTHAWVGARRGLKRIRDGSASLTHLAWARPRGCNHITATLSRQHRAIQFRLTLLGAVFGVVTAPSLQACRVRLALEHGGGEGGEGQRQHVVKPAAPSKYQADCRVVRLEDGAVAAQHARSKAVQSAAGLTQTTHTERLGESVQLRPSLRQQTSTPADAPHTRRRGQTPELC